MKTVVLTEAVHEAGIELLRARTEIDLIVAQGLAPGEFRAALAGADAIGVRTFRLGEDELSSASRLTIVSKHGVGCDNIAVDHLSARGIPVAIAADANAGSVAEHALMLMLAAAKRLPVYEGALRGGSWDLRKSQAAIDLAGRTVLVIGFGRIGRRVAALCHAFEMKVVVYDVAIAPEAAREAGIDLAPDLDSALSQADVVTIHIPYSSRTANLLDAARIGRIKHGAILVNCARGGIVDEAALVQALASGHLAAAGLDVFAQEPPPGDHPLLSLPNVVATPHSAALTQEGAKKMAISMARNILDCFDGRLDPRFVVNARELSL